MIKTNSNNEFLIDIKVGNLSAVATKLKKNPSLLTIQNEYGFTPFHYAAYHGQIEVLKHLHSKLKERDSSLTEESASSGNDKSTSTDRFSYEEIINYKCNRGYTAFHHACEQGNTECAEFLLERGVNYQEAATYINQYGEHCVGETPLASACRNPHMLSFVQHLVENKLAEITPSAAKATHPLNNALRLDDTSIASYLFKKIKEKDSKEKPYSDPNAFGIASHSLAMLDLLHDNLHKSVFVQIQDILASKHEEEICLKLIGYADKRTFERCSYLDFHLTSLLMLDNKIRAQVLSKCEEVGFDVYENLTKSPYPLKRLCHSDDVSIREFLTKLEEYIIERPEITSMWPCILETDDSERLKEFIQKFNAKNPDCKLKVLSTTSENQKSDTTSDNKDISSSANSGFFGSIVHFVKRNAFEIAAQVVSCMLIALFPQLSLVTTTGRLFEVAMWQTTIVWSVKSLAYAFGFRNGNGKAYETETGMSAQIVCTSLSALLRYAIPSMHPAVAFAFGAALKVGYNSYYANSNDTQETNNKARPTA